MTQQIQMAGETSFAALFAIAAVQGALVMNQYSSNPVGGLIVPPGLTVGCEDASKIETNQEEEPDTSTERGVFASQSISDSELEKMLCDASDTQVSCNMKKWWHLVTQALVLILPMLASGPVGMGLMRCSHLLHMAVIMGLAHVYDFFRKIPAFQSIDAEENDDVLTGDHPRVLVLGDSMAVGIGSCEVFDEEKVFDIPLHKEERLEITDENGKKVDTTLPGPVFPLVLARTLSHRLKKPVAWRSAGVDGGDTHEIGEYLLDVVKDEVAKGQAPDVVVILTGSNDLKQILKGSATVRGFRSNLMKLADDIRSVSPGTRVVLPSLPTFRLDQKSILNIFPLTIFLDGIIGFWDAQKIAVADRCPGVLHVDLTAAEVNQWYKEDARDGHGNVSLISADGIHPNGKCYAKWATLVGNKMVDALDVQRKESSAAEVIQSPVSPMPPRPSSGGRGGRLYPTPAFVNSGK